MQHWYTGLRVCYIGAFQTNLVAVSLPSCESSLIKVIQLVSREEIVRFVWGEKIIHRDLKGCACGIIMTLRKFKIIRKHVFEVSGNFGGSFLAPLIN